MTNIKIFKRIISETKKRCPTCIEMLDELEQESTIDEKIIICRLCGNRIKVGNKMLKEGV